MLTAFNFNAEILFHQNYFTYKIKKTCSYMMSIQLIQISCFICQNQIIGVNFKAPISFSNNILDGNSSKIKNSIN